MIFSCARIIHNIFPIKFTWKIFQYRTMHISFNRRHFLPLLRRRHTALSPPEIKWPVQSNHSHELPWGHQVLDGTELLTVEWQQVRSCPMLPPDFIKVITNILGNLSTLVKPHFKNLGVMFDSAFKLDKQVNAIIKANFSQLCTIAKIKPFLSFKDLEEVICAFISSRLDYCNFF